MHPSMTNNTFAKVQETLKFSLYTIKSNYIETSK